MDVFCKKEVISSIDFELFWTLQNAYVKKGFIATEICCTKKYKPRPTHGLHLRADPRHR